MGSVHAHCHPENPVVRKPLNPEVYYSITGTKHVPVEQKSRGQQYQLHITDISVNTGNKIFLLFFFFSRLVNLTQIKISVQTFGMIFRAHEIIIDGSNLFLQ